MLHYDVPAFLDDAKPATLAEFRLEAPRAYRFVLDVAQKQMIERYLGIYGELPVGIGRILSKVYVQRLFRHALADDDVDADLLGVQAGENVFRLAGLQN